ncbi:uncharacterized protein LOC115439898 isoform X2 [Manduca sexta]|uniref:uncharacterized protein LOC115439898 isoform X2 n=1 Tax=Manduca sexta TaxID=7130 RepID=UPI00188F3C20|nr:uncharacterized protein LOC115439898 isoform X2 [Manduca sexta]
MKVKGKIIPSRVIYIEPLPPNYHKINSVEEDYANQPDDSDINDNIMKLSYTKKDDQNCWMSLNAKQYFEIMGEFEEHYEKIRSNYHKQVGAKLDKEMLQAMLEIRGMAEREIHKAKGNINLIPAGLNLGGYCMMRMKDSILFFHRMKLRNDTHFRINFLQNDLHDMSLTVRLSLHDLHLVGAYERSPTDKDPSILFYAPSYGEIEFLLKNVNYKMEGRLRLLKDRLIIELVISELLIEDILMTYFNKELPGKPLRLRKENLEDFLDRLKTDLDKWLKDYFNDYLMYSTALSSPNQRFLEAEQERTMLLNEYADGALEVIKNRILRFSGNLIKIPTFTIYGATRMLIRLKDGHLRGLDSLYRRSVATGHDAGKVRKVDFIVGFSNLKVVYKYEAVLPTDTPPISGLLILSADELTARLGLSLVEDPEAVDIDIDFIQQMKPESLTVEGPANRMIANFKHLLEHHIIAIMSNTLIHSIKKLRSLPKCEPQLFQYIELDRKEHNVVLNSSEPGDIVKIIPSIVANDNTQVLHGNEQETDDDVQSDSHGSSIHFDSIVSDHMEIKGSPLEISSDDETSDDNYLRRHHKILAKQKKIKEIKKLPISKNKKT